jgi:predicted SAM-dependent methyltransferase
MKLKGETDHCRSRLLRYCQGQGLDLGCGACKIKADVIGIDLHHPEADMRRDARLLDYYANESFDYIYSSHLLEEIQDTEPTLREWLRVVKEGGYIVLYQADKDLYHPLGHPACNSSHKHHFSWETLWEIFQRIGNVELIHHGRYPQEPYKEWSFELVIRKNSSGTALEPIKKSDEGISLLIPTLNRPANMEEFAVNVDATTKDPNFVEILFGIHEEDTASIAKAEELNKKLKIQIRHKIIKRFSDGKVHLSYLWNQLYKEAQYPILGYFGDDVIFKTLGWDEEVRVEFSKSKTIMVLCNDVHIQRGKQATLFFTHKLVHDKVGYYLNMKFRRWFMDTFWDIVYRGMGKLIYKDWLITEHRHPDIFPDRKDETYTRMEAFKEQDRQRWQSNETRVELNRVVEILKELGDGLN